MSRAAPRAIVVLPDQGDANRDADARLEETAGLAAAIGRDGRRQARVPRPRGKARATLIGSGQVEQLAANVRMEEAASGRVRRRPDARPAAQSGNRARRQGDRSDRPDPRDLRRARRDRRRALAGRTGASRLSGRAAGAQLDPPRAPARRLRLSGRSRRNPDRGRSPPHPRSHGAACAASWTRSAARGDFTAIAASAPHGR